MLATHHPSVSHPFISFKAEARLPGYARGHSPTARAKASPDRSGLLHTWKLKLWASSRFLATSAFSPESSALLRSPRGTDLELSTRRVQNAPQNLRARTSTTRAPTEMHAPCRPQRPPSYVELWNSRLFSVFWLLNSYARNPRQSELLQLPTFWKGSTFFPAAIP